MLVNTGACGPNTPEDEAAVADPLNTLGLRGGSRSVPGCNSQPAPLEAGFGHHPECPQVQGRGWVKQRDNPAVTTQNSVLTTVSPAPQQEKKKLPFRLGEEVMM